MRGFSHILLTALLATSGTTVALAQAPAAANSPTLPPAGVYYRYWPEQFVQFLGDDLPYSLIVLYVDSRGKQPVYDVELIDRATGKPTHYTNTPGQAAIDQAIGTPAYLTKMAFDGPADPSNGAQYLLRFATEKGTPVEWQFVQGTDVSDHGTGLTPVQAPVPVLVYREQAALAGAGTALKFGNVTDTASVWTEYAQPPYFVPYHGALSVGVHILSFSPTATAWKAGTAGAAPTLTSPHGEVFTEANEADGTRLDDAEHGVSVLLEGGAGGALTRVQYGPTGAKQEHTISLTFTPPLADGVDGKFGVLAGKKSKLASGTVKETVKAGKANVNWTFDSPDFMKGKTAEASATITK